MGFLKKITRPISRFLDKIVPNEIKPALPYLSAAAPFLIGPAGIGASGSFWNTMMGRSLMAGGANLGSQLAQEGSEGEFDKMSLALASGIGALTAPGAASSIRGVDPNFVGPRVAPEGIMGTGKEWLAKGAEFLGPESGGASNILGRGGTKPGLNMATLKAAYEISNYRQGTGDWKKLAIRSAMEAAGHLEDDILDALRSLGLKTRWNCRS